MSQFELDPNFDSTTLDELMNGEPIAFLSVTNKDNIIELGQGLAKVGYRLVSTGGTAGKLEEAGLNPIPVTAITGMAETSDNLLKSIHTRVSGSALVAGPEHEAFRQQYKIPIINLMVCNYYPFTDSVYADTPIEKAVWKVDVGGPGMIHPTMKGAVLGNPVAPVTNPDSYANLLKVINEQEDRIPPVEVRRTLAAGAAELNAIYFGSIGQYFNQDSNTRFAWFKGEEGEKYGENWQQKRYVVFQDMNWTGPSVLKAEQLNPRAKRLSFNNRADADIALRAAIDYRTHLPDDPIAIIIKHKSPCGVASGETQSEAFYMAWDCDSMSAFGSVNGFTHPFDRSTASAQYKKFVEVNVGNITPHAMEWINDPRNGKKNLRVLDTGELQPLEPGTVEHTSLMGGFMEQEMDLTIYETGEVVTDKELSCPSYLVTPAVLGSKWGISNVVVMLQAMHGGTWRQIAQCAGQPNRVDALKFMMQRARRNLSGNYIRNNPNEFLVGTSSFFPEDDFLNVAERHGLENFVFPTMGTKRDKIIKRANRRDVSILEIDHRHFKH